MLERRTGVPKLYLAGGSALFISVTIFLNAIAGLTADLVGFVYPVWASFKALDSPEPDDDKKWYVL